MTLVPRTYLCSMPYCPNLVEGRPGRCPEHQTSWGTFKAKAPPGAYGAAWRRFRAGYLAGHARCEQCGAPATDVHHIDGDPLRNEWANAMALCQACHRTISGRRSAQQAQHEQCAPYHNSFADRGEGQSLARYKCP